MKFTYTKCKKCDSDFSCFFKHAKNPEKERIMLEIAKEASEGQRRLMEDSKRT